MAGRFRFVCHNGLVVGDVAHDIRVPHRGDIQGEVIEGAFRVLEDFEAVDEASDAMKSIELEPAEQIAFATAALALRFGERAVEQGGHQAAPVTAEQLNEARRAEDSGNSLWMSLQRVQENSLRGGLPGRTAQGRRIQTRPVGSIDRDVSLNRALWVLAEEMRKLTRDTVAALRAELAQKQAEQQKEVGRESEADAASAVSASAQTAVDESSATEAGAPVPHNQLHDRPRSPSRSNRRLHVEMDGQDYQLVVSVVPAKPGHLYVRPLNGGPRLLALASELKLRGFVGRG